MTRAAKLKKAIIYTASTGACLFALAAFIYNLI